MAHRIETLAVQGSPMEVFVCEPPGAGPHPALIDCSKFPLAHTGIENDAFTLELCERYADNGYVVAAPFVFHWWPKGADADVKRQGFRDDRTVLDLQATYDLLAGMPNVDANRIGILGHCWGGRVAWLGAAAVPGIKACAIFYGGRIREALGEGTPPAIDLAPNIKGPVMGFFGNEDRNPSPEDVDVYDEALTKAGVPHTFHRYDGAGHGFQNPHREEIYHAEADAHAWQNALAFFAGTLKP